MSQDKLFVIGVGGTGMRCLESFVHLCAIGMFDNKEINILTLDTDQENGNLKRVWDLVELYNRIKNPSGLIADKGGKPSANTFFSAKLNLFKYWPAYSGGVNFRTLSKIAIEDSKSVDNNDLATLFLDEPAQVFDLAHGYRAQTHLGSLLMYHSIMDAAKNHKSKGDGALPQERDLMKFIEELVKAKSEARVFIFGSIFGGTGASSIPVIPTAFRDAFKLLKDLPIEAKFGASLLTEYFTFKSPTDAQKRDKKNAVVADANYFTLNSQAALQFYQNDPTVQSTYKCLYNVGWPIGNLSDFSKNKNETETITGGAAQKNPCHVTELLCAFAAYDFFNRETFEKNEAEYLFRTVHYDNGTFNFDFSDFVGESKSFKNKLPGMYAIALLTLTYHQGADYAEGISGWMARMKHMKYLDYDNQIDEQCKRDLTDYFKSFLFHKKDGYIEDGWLFQVKNSFSGKFMLPASAFARDWKAITNINPGELIEDERSQWGKKKDAAFCSNKFVDEFINQKDNLKEDIQAPTGIPKEKLIAQLYNTITKLQDVQ
jgi:hypothetical protein